MSSLWRTPLLGPAVFAVWRADARRKLDLIRPWLPQDQSLLEIGSGPGSVLTEFRAAGYAIDGLDISDSSYDETLKPLLYDGGTMPFKDREYDTALLLTVLHHTPDPDAILKEAARVAGRVIVIEDVFENAWQRKYTKVADSITNLEFFGHPHTNRSDPEWRETFERLGLSLVHGEVHRLARIFRQAVYVVEANRPS
ncbi:MAG: class I SAM-dependent methyltransferase [Pseudomonadota bacterium]